MPRSSGFSRGLFAGATAAVASFLLNIPARAGFSPQDLAGFEVTHLRGVVSVVLPDEKVIEVIDPEGHKEIITVGIDMKPLGLSPGDGVDVSVLDGLVIDLQRSTERELSFSREDIIMPSDMGPLKQGMRLALASGTARVIKLSQKDRSISLMGPLGGIHNLDVVAEPDQDLFPKLKAGDLVDFRLIQPVAVAIDAVAASSGDRGTTIRQPLLAEVVDDDASLKAELLNVFEITRIQGTLKRLVPDQKVLELRSPYGHDMLITMGGDLRTAGLKPGDKVVVEILDGLVVDLRRSSNRKLSLVREDVILSEDFGAVRKGARVAMATGTAEVVKMSEEDHELSLRGPFGGIHNLDVREGISGDPLKSLEVGDFVEFRAIKPIAISIRKGG